MAIELKRLFDVPYYQLENRPKQDALAAKENGSWTKYSTQEYIDQANLISKGLLELGIQKGDKIAMISNNRPEWNIMDIGILQIGAINVPIYPTISEDDYRYIFNHAEIKVCVVSDEELLAKVNAVKNDVATLEHVYTFDQINGAEHWSSIKELGKNGNQEKVEELKNSIDSLDLATIIYTSGTTGTPKGVMLSHWNILSNAIASTHRLPTHLADKSLSFLPVCHIYERMLMYLYTISGISIYFAESLETIGDNLKEVKPEVFTAVPRLLEKVFDKIMDKGRELTGIKRTLFFWAVDLAEEWEPYGKKGAFFEMKMKIADKLIFSKWREAIGGNTLAVASGSAALSPRLARIFNAANIPVMEGYGLTETSPVCSVNMMEGNKFMIGTVGHILKDVEVKIAPDGEILVKGPNVMMGYYKAPEKTAEVIKDGWFHTGDIGTMVGPNKQFLKITDRKKEIFKTSGGKYVAPQPIENMIKASRFIEQAIVVGEGKKHPAAIIVPAFETLTVWCKRHDIDSFSPENIIQNEKVRDLIMEEVKELTEELGNWERPKKIELCSQLWSVDTGELTPTLKLKRKKILAKYDHLMKNIYED